jgi:AraC family transcriptional regulator of adaptative response / DNA-3-methyladenine glycosylase II
MGPTWDENNQAAGSESLLLQARAGLDAAAYRQIANGQPFRLTLPRPYPTAITLRHLGRDALSHTERVNGSVAEVAAWFSGEPATLRMEFTDNEVQVSASPNPAPYEAHALAVRMLGFAQDAPAFESHAASLGLSSLVRGREGARIPQTPSFFDALVWSIVGQQVGLGFAYTMRRRLAELLNPPMPSGLRPPPLPHQVAALDEADLLPLQFSRRKAEYLIGIARNLPNVEGMPAAQVESTLLAVRGIGPWAANYVMMRGLGFSDCVPLGDTGLLAGLRKLHGRPVEQKEVADLMAPFAPYRSLATFHLWQSLAD